MPAFSRRSKKNLETVHPILQEILEELIVYYDFTVLEGHRGEEAQEKAFKEGRSKAHFGQSAHNSLPSLAVDIAPHPIDWDDRERFVLLAGRVILMAEMLGYAGMVRWGGDWDQDGWTKDENFRDYPHFELMI